MSSWWRRLWPSSSRKMDVSSESIWLELYGGRQSKAGARVNLDTATRVSAFFACGRVIADGLAQVPWRLLRETNDGTGTQRQSARDHRLFDLLYRRPNAWQTSYEFRECLGLHVAFTGNFFAFKNVVLGETRELIPLLPLTVTPKRNAQSLEITYDVRGPNGTVVNYPASQIWHVRGPSWDTWSGLDPLSLMREALGLAIVTEEAQARLHQSGSQVPGLISVDGVLPKDEYNKMREWLAREHGGVANWWKEMILDRGAKYHRFAQTATEAQHLETRHNQIAEVCRFMRVLPIMIGHTDKAQTFASSEQQFLAHVVHTLMPWYSRIEQSADVNLLSEADRRDGLYTKFVVEGLLRGAMKDRADFLLKMTTAGIMTPNEARDTLDLNPLPGLDTPRVPMNTEPVTGDTEPEKDPEGENA